jgi:hypothetical protein
MNNLTVPAFATVVLLAILILILSPFITIWSLNTLFLLGIEYTVWTWLACAWLSLMAFNNVIAIRKDRSMYGKKDH